MDRMEDTKESENREKLFRLSSRDSNERFMPQVS